MTQWQHTFDDKELQWQLCPYTLTIDTKLRAFQYKYILKILPDNSFLHKYCSVQSSLCAFLFHDKRTTLTYVQGMSHHSNLFGEMLVFLQNKLSINIELSYKKNSFCSD